MRDPYSFIAGFMFMTAVIGFAFTAGRNYEKRQLRKRTVAVSAGTAYIGGEKVDIPAQSVPLAVILPPATRHDLTCSYHDCIAPPGSEDHVQGPVR